MMELPENKFQIFYDHEADHYRVILDDVDLTHNIAFGGIKVDFSTMVNDWDSPTVTLVFPAAGGLDVTLPDGEKLQQKAVAKAASA